MAIDVSKRLNHWQRVVSLLQSRKGSAGLNAAQRLELSEALLRVGNPKEAESILGELIAEFPDQEGLSHQLAFLYVSQGLYPKAAEVYSSFLKRNPRAVESLVNLALIEFRLELTAAALNHLGRAFEADYARANDFFYRQLVRNMPPEGLSQLAEDTKKALGLPPDGPQAHLFIARENENLSRYQSAITAYEAYLASVSDEDSRYRLARLYFLAGESKKSEELVRQLIAAGGPIGYSAGLLGAELAVRSNDFQRAAHLLASLPSEYRNNSTYRYAAGRVALNQEDFAEAEKHLSEVVRNDPERAEAYFHLGQIYLRTGRVEKGRQMMQEFQNRRP